MRVSGEFGVITIQVWNMERAQAFYADTLGMEVVDDLSSAGYVVLRPARGALLILQLGTEMSRQQREPFGIELGIVVDDLDDFWTRWQKTGEKILVELSAYPLGRTFVGKGPEGHRLRFYEFEEAIDLCAPEGIDNMLGVMRRANQVEQTNA